LQSKVKNGEGERRSKSDSFGERKGAGKTGEKRRKKEMTKGKIQAENRSEV